MPLAGFDLSLSQDCGGKPVVGVDEAGRGPLAGPVTACAALIPTGAAHLLSQVDDSKKLTPARREKAFARMSEAGVLFGFGYALHSEIDSSDILSATFLAMRRALERLSASAGRPLSDFVVAVDGSMKIRGLEADQRAIVGGDGKSLAIACASVRAKVLRDRWMARLDGLYPGYGFAGHKGYGSAGHMAAIREKGPSPVHRLSFAPARRGQAPLKAGV
ncbi:MAG: ribonuclease HII [Elusimicrobia bacterium]|nr:MAG: ribonuclease HII [Elusimicrobiota bacterium]KAF0154083.1 MAG: ribonuclease HII [Elusimicrobiota bacterium]